MVEPLDLSRVRRDQLGRGERAKPEQARRFLDRQAGQIRRVAHASSWIAGTRKKPSTAAGALARASAWLRQGRGTSSLNVLATSTTCAGGGIESVSSSFSRSVCAGGAAT